jgi:hypothetical protein
MLNIREELLKEFNDNELEWRVQSCGINNNKPWVMALVYVQARAIQERLDNVFGWDNWTEEYREVSGNIICRLGVYSNDIWVYKENGSGQTDIESFKGGISVAFKRVASSGYGIGRYLYKVEAKFVECSIEKLTGYTEKARTKDKKTIYWKIPKLNEQTIKKINDLQLKKLCTMMTETKTEDTKIKEYIKKEFGINSKKDLNINQFEIIINMLNKKIKKEKKAV